MIATKNEHSTGSVKIGFYINNENILFYHNVQI